MRIKTMNKAGWVFSILTLVVLLQSPLASQKVDPIGDTIIDPDGKVDIYLISQYYDKIKWNDFEPLQDDTYSIIFMPAKYYSLDMKNETITVDAIDFIRLPLSASRINFGGPIKATISLYNFHTVVINTRTKNKEHRTAPCIWQSYRRR